LAAKINGNGDAQQETSVDKSFKRNWIISTRIPNLRLWCKKLSNWTSGVGQKIRLRLPLLLGIRLQPKTSYSLGLRLRNPGLNPQPFRFKFHPASRFLINFEKKRTWNNFWPQTVTEKMFGLSGKTLAEIIMHITANENDINDILQTFW